MYCGLLQVRLDNTHRSISSATKLYAFCAALNSCNLGYDIGVNTGAGKLVQDSLNLSNFQLEMFMGSLNLFAMVGALSSNWISDKLGRRWAFRVAAIGFIFGMVVQSGAGGVWKLAVWKGVCWIGSWIWVGGGSSVHLRNITGCS